MKGFTLLRLLMILSIFSTLIIISTQIYNDYITRARLTNLLSETKLQKIKLTEDIRQNKQVDNDHSIILDTDHIVPDSMLVISPIIINDNVYWGCNHTGLTREQVPHFCDLNDFTSPNININNQVSCEVTHGISYDNVTKTFSVRALKDGQVIDVGSFDDIKKAVSSYTELLGPIIQ